MRRVHSHSARLFLTRDTAPELADSRDNGRQRGRRVLLRGQRAFTFFSGLATVIETALLSGEAGLTGAEQLRGRDGFDLESTLAVRRLYAAFRRSLRRPQGETAEAVLTALRYAAGGLATLMSSPAYERARVSDRRLLRRLQERLLLWARSGRAVTSGLELLDDVWTCADLLRDINRRQELKVHDASLLRQLTCATSDATEHWLHQLGSLFGLDDALDLLIDQSQVNPSPDLVRQLRARLAKLACSS